MPGPPSGLGSEHPSSSLSCSSPSFWNSQTQPQSSHNFSLAWVPSPQREASLPSSMRQVRESFCSHSFRAGPVPGGGSSKSPEQRTYRDLSRRQRGSVCLSHRARTARAKLAPALGASPPQHALGHCLCPFMNSRLLEGRQHLGSVSGKQSGRKSSSWIGATLEWKPKPQEREPGTGAGDLSKG